MAAEPNEDIKAMSFEQALAALERIVDDLERGDVPLDQSIRIYERGEALKAHCDGCSRPPRTRSRRSACRATASRSARAAGRQNSDLFPALEGAESGVASMCRTIKTLHNFEPPATHDEIRDAALQFVRKLSGTTRPVARATRRPSIGPSSRSRKSRTSCSTRWRRSALRATARKKLPRRGEDAASGSHQIPLHRAVERVLTAALRREGSMSFFPARDPEPGDAFACDAIELMVIATPRISAASRCGVRCRRPSGGWSAPSSSSTAWVRRC